MVEQTKWLLCHHKEWSSGSQNLYKSWVDVASLWSSTRQARQYNHRLYLDPNNHTEIILITTLPGQLLRYIPS